MKGRYSGRHMTVYGHILPKARSIALWYKRSVNLSDKAKHRLKIIDWYYLHGENISLTSRHFGIQRSTLRRWLKRLKKEGLVGLNDKSHRPYHLREPSTLPEIQLRVVKIRKSNPYWSKYKISAYLEQQEGIKIHPSTVGKILKRKGLINNKISKKKKKAALSPKKRYPKGLIIKEPGDLIQIDTKYLTGIGGRKLYQYSAVDVLTKIRVLSVSTSISSKQARSFLFDCLKEFPFRIKSIQTDNGSEFLGFFDKELKRLNIPHYFIYPHSPKQNSYVERSHLTDEYEFYRQGMMRSSVKELLPLLKEWQYKYNYLRPHQALGYLTPMKYLEEFKAKKGRIPTRDYLVLQT